MDRVKKCENCRHFFYDNSTGASDCGQVNEMSEEDMDHYFMEGNENCPCYEEDDDYMEDNGRFALEKTNPLIYSHGGYYETGKKLGTFGYSVRKKKKRKKPNGRKK